VPKYTSRGEELLATTPYSDWGLEVAKGDIPGVSLLHKFGRNPDIDTAAGFEAIWNGGGAYTGHDATAAETVEVFSSDANDASAGTGARTVEVFGLDSNFAEQNETVTLNGVTAVDTASTYIRLDRAIVRTAGSGAVNAGAITARQNVTTANVFMVLPIGYNQTMISAWTVPADKTAYLLAWGASLAGKTQANCNIRLKVRPENEVFQVKEEFSISATGSSAWTRDYDIPKLILTEKTDIYIEADTDSNDSGVSGYFDLAVVDN
jgi:hypothetical protein